MLFVKLKEASVCLSFSRTLPCGDEALKKEVENECNGIQMLAWAHDSGHRSSPFHHREGQSDRRHQQRGSRSGYPTLKFLFLTIALRRRSSWFQETSFFSCVHYSHNLVKPEPQLLKWVTQLCSYVVICHKVQIESNRLYRLGLFYQPYKKHNLDRDHGGNGRLIRERWILNKKTFLKKRSIRNISSIG